MVNKHMKRCLASLVIREIQIKTTMKYLFRPTRTAIIFKKENKCRQGGGKNWDHCTLFVGMLQSLWKAALWFLKKLNVELIYNFTISFLGIYPPKLKTGTQILVYECS